MRGPQTKERRKKRETVRGTIAVPDQSGRERFFSASLHNLMDDTPALAGRRRRKKRKEKGGHGWQRRRRNQIGDIIAVSAAIVSIFTALKERKKDGRCIVRLTFTDHNGKGSWRSCALTMP